MPMSPDAKADVDADDDADGDGDQNEGVDVKRHFYNHPIFKVMAMMLALSSGDNFGLDGDLKHVDVRIMG